MPDATEKPVKLTERDKVLLRECCRYNIMDDCGEFYRIGGFGTVPIRFNARSLPRLESLGLVKRRNGAWNATPLGRTHPAVTKG